jgi:hypothetical protein
MGAVQTTPRLVHAWLRDNDRAPSPRPELSHEQRIQTLNGPEHPPRPRARHSKRTICDTSEVGNNLKNALPEDVEAHRRGPSSEIDGKANPIIVVRQ